MNELKGKGTVVTGAASGIGRAIATAFIEAGASVLLCDLQAKALDTVASELGDRAIGRVTDVSECIACLAQRTFDLTLVQLLSAESSTALSMALGRFSNRDARGGLLCGEGWR